MLPNWSHFAHYFTYRSVWGAQPILAISLQCCRNMMDVRLSHPAIVWFPYHSVSPGIRNQGHACPETRILGLSCLKTPTQEHVCPKILTLKSKKKINKVKFLSLSLRLELTNSLNYFFCRPISPGALLPRNSEPRARLPKNSEPGALLWYKNCGELKVLEPRFPRNSDPGALFPKNSEPGPLFCDMMPPFSQPRMKSCRESSANNSRGSTSIGSAERKR